MQENSNRNRSGKAIWKVKTFAVVGKIDWFLISSVSYLTIWFHHPIRRMTLVQSRSLWTKSKKKQFMHEKQFFINGIRRNNVCAKENQFSFFIHTSEFFFTRNARRDENLLRRREKRRFRDETWKSHREITA